MYSNAHCTGPPSQPPPARPDASPCSLFSSPPSSLPPPPPRPDAASSDPKHHVADAEWSQLHASELGHSSRLEGVDGDELDVRAGHQEGGGGVGGMKGKERGPTEIQTLYLIWIWTVDLGISGSRYVPHVSMLPLSSMAATCCKSHTPSQHTPFVHAAIQRPGHGQRRRP